MRKYYSEMVASIKQIAPKEANQWVGEKYLGTTHKYLGVGTLPKRKLAKDWKKLHTDITYEEYIKLLDLLYKGNTYEEKTVSSELLNLYPDHRHKLDLNKIYEWLGELNGWAELDILCQGSFSAEEVLERWSEWKKFLIKLNKDKDIRRRRASLVLLCKSVRGSDDIRLSELAFKNIKNVQNEKDILITKAVSWLLRNLIKYHKKEVEDYLKENEDKLPKIALRETRRKLLTGRK